MALTANTVQSTYLDLVQLEKSGAGLPSHAGKEAALYDGSGAQILGRTAVRHWLDPDPDATAASSWEFSTYGDATQGELETAGWAFSGCTAVASNGMLILTKTAAYDTIATATLTVSLSGDFDYVACFSPPDYTGPIPAGNTLYGSLWVADSSGKAHGMGVTYVGNPAWGLRGYRDSTYASLAGGSLYSLAVGAAKLDLIRVARYSGTVLLYGGAHGWGTGCGTSIASSWRGTTQADASTFNKLFFLDDAQGKVNQGFKTGIRFLRRFA